MLCGGNFGGVNEANPIIIFQSFFYATISGPGDEEDGWCNILGLGTSQPRRVPKLRRLPITDGDGSGVIIQVHVITRQTKADPGYTQVLLLPPRPTQPQAMQELVQVEDAQ